MCHVVLHGSFTQVQSEQPGPVGSRLSSTKRMTVALASMGDVISLFEKCCGLAGREVKPATQG